MLAERMIDAQLRIRQLRSGTHALIDLDAYARNIARLRAMAPGGAFMAVVKADAYGHGAAICGQAAIQAGADMLGVARISEALYLRAQGVTAPILVLGPPSEGALADAISSGVTLAVGSERALVAIEAAAGASGMSATVHLKMDTGMRRYGFLSSEIVAIAERLHASPLIELEGVFTHFTSSDDLVDTSTPGQIDQFERVTDEIERLGMGLRYRHMANSAAILRGQIGRSNLVRSGIATYGLSPSDEVPVDERFEPIMSIRSVVARRFVVQPGESVSYNQTFVADLSTQAADIPIGYADGLPRNVSNIGWFVIDGERCPILGRVCMDQVVARTPDGVSEGAEVIILGSGCDGEMTYADAGRLAGTNNYEVATRLMARVPRIYLRDGQPVAWEHLLEGDRGNCVPASMG